MNGMRVGWFISQSNPSLISALKMTSKLYMLSSTSDALFSNLISDTKFFHQFVQTNRERLSKSYELARSFCEFHKIGYTPSNAGHFMLIDLKPFVELMRSQGATTTTTTTTSGDGKILSTKVEHRVLTDEEAETALWARGLSHKILITPGSNYHHPDLGIFRLTFSLPREFALEGFSRLEKVLGLNPWKPTPETEIWDPKSHAESMKQLEFLIEEEVSEGTEKKRKREVNGASKVNGVAGEETRGHWERFEEDVMGVGKRKRTTTVESEGMEEKENSPGPGEGNEFDPQLLKDLKGMQSACGACMC